MGAGGERPVHLLIGYFPMLRGTAGTVVDTSHDGSNRAVVELLEGVHDGRAAGLLWMQGDDGLQPVFIMEGAREVAEHLEEWSEGAPTKWFELHVVERASRYAVVLSPKPEMSIRRYEAAMAIAGKHLPKEVDYRILFASIWFASEPGAETFRKIKSQLRRQVRVGFIDAKDLSPEMDRTDWSLITSFGPFDVIREPNETVRSLIDAP